MRMTLDAAGLALAIGGAAAAQSPATSANPSAAVARLPDGAYLGT